MKTLSVCIPTYEMNGVGHVFLKQSLDILTHQSFEDFDVVISDHARTDVIQDLCNEYKDRLDIRYYRNNEKIGSSSANLNNAIRNAAGTLIKILFQDDFLYSENSLQDTINGFDVTHDHWLVTACEHTRDGVNYYRPFYPKYNDKIHLGNNTISSPSVLTIKNERPLLFDESLTWFMDCDYYKRCHDAFGDPKILDTITVVNRTGVHQVSNTVADRALRKREYRYIIEKYGESVPFIEKVRQLLR